MFRDALEYPFRTDEKLRQYGIGVLVYYGMLLILPIFLYLGYYVKVMRESLKGNDEMAKWEGFSKLFVDGIKMFGVIIAYFLLAAISMWILGTIGTLTGIEAVFMTLGLISAMIFFYMLPSAMANFARQDRGMAALDLRAVASKAFRKKYLIGMISLFGAFILITLAQIVAIIGIGITIIGIPALFVVLPAMFFYEHVVYHRIIAKAVE